MLIHIPKYMFFMSLCKLTKLLSSHIFDVKWRFFTKDFFESLEMIFTSKALACFFMSHDFKILIAKPVV